jgi:hypothetical protein
MRYLLGLWLGVLGLGGCFGDDRKPGVPEADTAEQRDNCFIGGCSHEACTPDEAVASPCIFVPKYACYRDATCERQADGACGWTATAELTSCLAQFADN